MSEEREILAIASRRVGTVVHGKYAIERVLGVGGMAVVYAATHRNRMRCAVKMLHASLSAREDIRRRFLKEGYVANSVNHPGVVRIVDDDVAEDGSAFLVMELLEGESLDKFGSERGTRLPLKEALGIAHQVLDVLEAAHANDVVHRDIKPANVFLCSDGRIKVLDFGIARLRETWSTESTATGLMLGTPAFIAPEQALGQTAEIDVRTDVWAVGATLFTMLTGQIVHAGDNAQQLIVAAATVPARSLAQALPEAPAAVVEVVDRALEFKRAERWQSAAIMREAVGRVYREIFDASPPEVVDRFACVATAAPVGQGATGPAGVDGLGTTVADTTGTTARPVLKQIAKTAPGKGRFAMLVALSALVSVAVAGALSVQSCGPGELAVLVTTNMAVPYDIDTLSWTAAIEGESKPFESGSLSLAQGLPAMSFSVPAPDGSEPVLLRVNGWRGGTRGALRVSRAARVDPPNDGAQSVTVALDWLCSDANQSPQCSPHQTCEAGGCVDLGAAQNAVGAFAEDSAASACFDVQKCFTNGVPVVPFVEPGVGCMARIDTTERASVALVVDTSRGPSGVCGPFGCLAPLERGGPAGWETVPGGIRLPPAVCQRLGTTLRSVVSAAACAPRSAGTPLCAAEDTCVVSDLDCPKDWLGYSCTGPVPPQSVNRSLTSCWLASGDVPSSEDPARRWCCSLEPSHSDDPLLIDDMSGGPLSKIKPPPGFRTGFWFSASDALNAPLEPRPLPVLFRYAPIDPPIAPREAAGPTIRQAACLRSDAFAAWIALMGLSFVERGNETAAPFDVSKYSGVRFWAMSRRPEQTIRVQFPDHNTMTEIPDSTCRKLERGWRDPEHPEWQGKCGDDWALQRLELTTQWTEYSVRWTDLTQMTRDWGQARFPAFLKDQVYGILFAVVPKGEDRMIDPFDFCVSQIYFTQDENSGAPN